MKFLRLLLYPFSVVYDVATRIRNRLYDTGTRPSVGFELPVISVGNLSVGGTGKTPMVEYLIRLLAAQYRIATLSRGYGRKTRGFRIAGQHDDATTIGDEPLQCYRKFHERVVVTVGEERALAVPFILHERPEINLILLDDAFQHRSIRPSFQILLTSYPNLFVHDLVLPAGRLRESKKGASRADVVVVTKCPATITDEEMIDVERAIRRYANKAVFFSRIEYADPVAVGEHAPYKPDKVVLLTGIANPAPLVEYARRNFDLVKHFTFADHHVYTQAETQKVCAFAANAGAAVVTTEKDVVKLDSRSFEAASVPLLYIPIAMGFLKNGKEFDEMVLNAARTYVG